MKIFQIRDEFYQTKEKMLSRLDELVKEEISQVKELTQEQTREILEHIKLEVEYLGEGSSCKMFFDDSFSVFVDIKENETLVMLTDVLFPKYFKKYEISEHLLR